jgi:TonB family protein
MKFSWVLVLTLLAEWATAQQPAPPFDEPELVEGSCRYWHSLGLLLTTGPAADVIVQFVVDTGGTLRPGSLRVVSSRHDSLNARALEEFAGCRYQPHPPAHRPVAVRLKVPVHFRRSLERRYVAYMKSSLRELVSAQEAFFADSTTYAGSLQALRGALSVSSGTPEALRYRSNLSSSWATGEGWPWEGVTVEIRASGTGWSGVARHLGTSRTCSLFVGTAASPIPGGSEGEPICN